MPSDPRDGAQSRPADQLIGRQLGNYRIDAFIGAGGMGAVYRAKDVRLGRDVAVKVLPAEFAADPDRLQRFEQEARAVAALSHPNILALHDLVTSDGATSMVTELLQGRTLRELLATERLTVRRVVDLATQLAEGLAAAHSRGVVHRDIKPDNVFVNNDGVVKILDFGLSRVASPSTNESTKLATAPNMVLGTPGYMSPEQVRGQPSDRRADVFAFGAVLYEMLAGQPAFKGDSASDLMSAILRDTPARLASTPERPIPPALAHLVDRCLEKTPDARFESTRDLAFALKTLSDVSSYESVASNVAAVPTGSARRLWTSVAIGTFVVAAIALAWWLGRAAHETPAQPVQSFSWALGDAQLTGLIDPFALTPDDTALIYASGSGLFRRPISALEANLIPGTEGMSGVFFSPDRKWMGFSAFSQATGSGKIMKVPIEGGTALEIVPVNSAIQGASWSSDDQIIFARAGLWRVASSGGTPELIEPASLGGAIVWPQALEHGAILYTSVMTTDTSRDSTPAAVLRLADGTKRTLATDAMHAQYVQPGYLVFGRGSTIMAAKLDLRRPDAMPAPIVVKDDVFASRHLEAFFTRFSVSARGSLAYAPGKLVPVPGQIFSWIDRGTGEATVWPFGPMINVAPRISPDGSLVAMTARDPDSFAADRLWIGDFARGTKQVLAEGSRSTPVWTRDGKVIYRKLDGGVWLRPADLSAPERQIVPPSPRRSGLETSPDGNTLVWSESDNQKAALWVLTGFAEGATKARLFRDDAVQRSDARFSPDGKWIAYISGSAVAQGARRGTLQVEPFPGPGPIVTVSVEQVSSIFGTPSWRNNELFWLSKSGDVMGVTYTTSPTFSPSAPRLILKARENGSFIVSETSLDGRRFLAYRREAPAPLPSQINVVLNWVEELKQRIK